MEIGLIRQSLITRDFEVLNEVGEVIDILTVTWDRNLFTGDYERRQGHMYETRVKDIDKLIRKRYPALVASTTTTAAGHGGRRKKKPRAKKSSAAVSSPSAEEAAALETAAELDELQTVEAPAPNDFLGRAVEQFVNQKEIDALLNDLARAIIADSLAVDRYGVVKRWSMTRETRTVEPTFTELVPLPLPFLNELQEFMKEESNPKGAGRMLRVRTTTSDNTDVSSPSALPTPTPESPSTSTPTE